MECPREHQPDIGDQTYVTAGGHRIRLQRRNISHGHPLILINGIGAAIEMWRPLVDELDDPGTD
jgi:hypothetical protein